MHAENFHWFFFSTALPYRQNRVQGVKEENFQPTIKFAIHKIVFTSWKTFAHNVCNLIKKILWVLIEKFFFLLFTPTCKRENSGKLRDPFFVCVTWKIVEDFNLENFFIINFNSSCYLRRADKNNTEGARL
jgi:hypothetical protein